VNEFSAPGSGIAVESIRVSRSVLLGDQLAQQSQEWGIDLDELFNTEERAEPADVLAEFGWQVQRDDIPDVATEYGRELSGMAEVMSQVGSFLTATRQ
jgi:hypothetical protein